MPGADPFVAIHPPQLKHPLHAANQQSLEVQFERNPQVQRHIERVVMRFERAGRGAAGHGMQRRAFDLDKPLAGQC